MAAPSSQTQIRFEGTRGELFGKLLRGYLLMVPTLGVYRFWVTTAKRRFYWQNTIIDGDPLEYTGSARQLLLGFLFAIAFFLPVYIAFFVLATQAGLITVIGNVVLLSLLWFFIGYAQYRGRDFRLSRTLWRGIRFDQKGSAMLYATRRFLWTLLTIVTLGLAYPFMAASLWRYRYSNTWFGDRQMSFAGNWKTLAGPFYRAYGIVVAVGLMFLLLSLSGTALAISLAPLAVLVTLGLAFFYWRARETSRMFSQVRLGEARLKTRIKARWLFGQYLVVGLLLVVLLVVAGLAIYWIVNGYYHHGQIARPDFRSIAYSGWSGALIVVGGYLLGFGTFSLLTETIIDLGYWKLVGRGSEIENIESLRDVKATDEDKSVLGEGLADALNVGSF